MSRYGWISLSLMYCQMIRVISSPSSSTTGLATLILAMQEPFERRDWTGRWGTAGARRYSTGPWAVKAGQRYGKRASTAARISGIRSYWCRIAGRCPSRVRMRPSGPATIDRGRLDPHGGDDNVVLDDGRRHLAGDVGHQVVERGVGADLAADFAAAPRPDTPSCARDRSRRPACRRAARRSS